MYIILLLIIIILLIINNQLVSNGASYGLMLWYKNVLPLLLPFMLISGIIENSVVKYFNTNKTNKKIPIFTILFLGIFCGYPIGAKTSAYFLEHNLISKRIGNILLPICNNLSPMFFIGFILTFTLHNTVPPYMGYILLYLPYIIILIIEATIVPRNPHTTHSKDINHNINISSHRSISEQSINQITHVGLYIMLCSIIIEFVLSLDFLSSYSKMLLTGITEITRGITYIDNTDLIDEQTKTALILGLSSFGGISSVMQTNKVIQGSGLSLIHYLIVKILCAIGTYYLCLLII